MAADPRLFSPPEDKRLFVILGPFGTGKTEISLNLALALAAQGRQAALADLDLVNPYFRSREKEDVLEQAGVRLIAPEGALRHADLPSIPPALWQLVFNKELSGVLDIGGDRTGARVLGAYAADIIKQEPAVWYVFNRSRYDNAGPQAAMESLRQIEAQAGMKVDGILHNTHLLGDTTADTVLQGAEAAAAFASLAGLPLICHCARRELLDILLGLSPIFPIDTYMARPWEA